MSFSLHKREQRRNLLATAAQSAARLVSADVHNRSAVCDAVTVCPRGEVLDSLVEAYIKEVDGFKKAHGYGHGKRINNAKIAALMTRTLLRQGVDDLFVISPRLVGQGLEVPVALLFAWELVCSTLDLNRKQLPTWIRDDFVAMMVVCDDVPPESLCFAMGPIWQAFGNKAVNLED